MIDTRVVQVISVIADKTSKGDWMWRCTTTDGEAFNIFEKQRHLIPLIQDYAGSGYFDETPLKCVVYKNDKGWTNLLRIEHGDYVLSERPFKFNHKWALNVTSAPYMIFDTETTGTDPNTAEICQIAWMVKERNGQIHRHIRLIKPSSPIPPESTAVHGINDDMVANAPTFAEFIPTFLFWLVKSSRIIAYNADYDATIINRQFVEGGLGTTRLDVDCIMRQYWYGRKWGKLSEAIAEIGISTKAWDPEKAHNALYDVDGTYLLLDTMAYLAKGE